MPQANITYDLPYNRKIVDVLKEMDEKHWRKAGDAYAPTMFSEKLGNFHGAKIGGGSPANQQYILSGNSPAYPPINMNSGMAVHSGGAFYSGIDGAVGGSILGDIFPPLQMLGLGQPHGGYSIQDFGRDVGSVGKAVAPFAPLLLGLGKKKSKKGGYSIQDFGRDVGSVGKAIAPFAPLLMGLGYPSPASKLDIVSALSPLGAKKSHSLKKLHELVAPYKLKSGGFSFGKLAKDLGRNISSVGKAVVSNPVVQEVGKDLLKQGLNMGKDALVSYATGAGRKGKKAKKGGAISEADLDSMVEMVRPMDMAVSKGKGKKGGFSFSKIAKDIGNTAKSVGKAVVSNPVVQEVGKDLLKQGLNMGKDALVSYATGAGRGGKKRADIVRQVMDEKGLSMIEASKYVKQNGLYKAVKKDPAEMGEKGGRARRAEIVRKVMAEKGLKMIEASKYVKANGLY